MPSQRVLVQSDRSGPRGRAPKGAIRATYDALTSAENASLVRGVAFFGAAVTFLASSWGEWLLVPQ